MAPPEPTVQCLGHFGFGEIDIVDVAMSPDAVLEKHTHTRIHVCIVLRGGFEESGPGYVTDVAPGVLRISPAGDPHTLRFGPSGARCLLIEAPDTLQGIGPTPQQSGRVFVSDPFVVDQAKELVTAFGDPTRHSSLAATAITLELLAQGHRPRRSGDRGGAPPWLIRLRERLLDDPLSPPSLQECAALTEKHPVYVVRAFRQHFGCSIGAYARLHRARQAYRLITTSDRPLGRVALETGYADQSHMTRDTRRYFGRTPGQLRVLGSSL